MSLSDRQIERYSRQIVLPEIGGRGQEALLGSAAAVIGTGGAAETAAFYLAGAGVGNIDLFPGSSEATEAARVIADGLLGLNPEIRVQVDRLPGDFSAGWTEPYGVVLAAGDSATLRRVAADCGRGALIAGGTIGACAWLWVGRGNPAAPCAVCAERGAARLSVTAAGEELGSAAGVLGSLLALTALKQLLGVGAEPRGWWFYEARAESLTLRQETVNGCSTCRERRNR